MNKVSPSGVEYLFGCIGTNFIDRLTKIIIGPDTFKLKEVNSTSLKVSIDSYFDDVPHIMDLLLGTYGMRKQSPQIYIHITTSIKCDMKPLLNGYSKELHISDYLNIKSPVTTSGEFHHCPTLTQLTFQGLHIDKSVPKALSRAIHSGKLPSLRRITLIKCCGGSSSLDWPKEVTVSMEGIEWDCYHCAR